MTLAELKQRLAVPSAGEPYKRAVRDAIAAKRGAPPDATDDPDVLTAGPVGDPVMLTVPWDLLVSDNKRHGKPTTAKDRAENKQYRGLKRAMTATFRKQAPPHPVAPATITVDLYVGDLTDFDPPNLWKALADALRAADVIPDDRWRDVPRWTIGVAGYDPARPRAEITVQPLG